jgi:phospholipase C
MEEDNFDDNGFAWFDAYRNSKPGDPLYDKGMYRSENLTEEFRKDYVSGNLPQVSMIIAPAWLSEHA